MTISHIATRQEWLAARLDRLAKEKAVRREEALVEQRRALPWHDMYGASEHHAHKH
jgi:predicted dithiol-disulfide oxidoreductase (DUF899 family)